MFHFIKKYIADVARKINDSGGKIEGKRRFLCKNKKEIGNANKFYIVGD